jgi:hypothetical protein
MSPKNQIQTISRQWQTQQDPPTDQNNHINYQLFMHHNPKTNPKLDNIDNMGPHPFSNIKKTQMLTVVKHMVQKQDQSHN